MGLRVGGLGLGPGGLCGGMGSRLEGWRPVFDLCSLILGLRGGSVGFGCHGFAVMDFGVWDVQGELAGWWLGLLGTVRCVRAWGIGLGGWRVILSLGNLILGLRGEVIGLVTMCSGTAFLGCGVEQVGLKSSHTVFFCSVGCVRA